MGVNFIVLGFASMNGFHIEGMAQNKGDVFLGAQIRDPVPGEHAFYSNDDIFPERLYDIEQGFPVGFYIAVKHDLSPGIQDAHIHFFSYASRFHRNIYVVWCKISWGLLLFILGMTRVKIFELEFTRSAAFGFCMGDLMKSW